MHSYCMMFASSMIACDFYIVNPPQRLASALATLMFVLEASFEVLTPHRSGFCDVIFLQEQDCPGVFHVENTWRCP